ncbi:MAG TPA: biotin/lipoyl-containing protein [Gemmatimonadaceae bacterium]|nr:biotin/lipoyl-containing protein [Gemmatimonadaceae bacterium]
MKYHVRVGDEEIEVVVEGDDVTVNGRKVRAHLDAAAEPLHMLTVDGAVHQVVAKRGADRGSFELSIGGRRFSVEALDARAKAIRALSDAGGKAAGPAHLMAPMPGLIVRVNVSAGDQVQPGQGLVVMEAMKMENELRASAAGTVKRVVVNPGSAVEKGALLLEME